MKERLVVGFFLINNLTNFSLMIVQILFIIKKKTFRRTRSNFYRRLKMVHKRKKILAGDVITNYDRRSSRFLIHGRGESMFLSFHLLGERGIRRQRPLSRSFPPKEYSHDQRSTRSPRSLDLNSSLRVFPSFFPLVSYKWNSTDSDTNWQFSS